MANVRIAFLVWHPLSPGDISYIIESRAANQIPSRRLRALANPIESLAGIDTFRSVGLRECSVPLVFSVSRFLAT